MLYLLYGSDTEKARAKARELLESLQKKKPQAEVFRIDPSSRVELTTGHSAENWFETRIDELVSSQGLFNSNYIVYFTNVFESPEAKEGFLKKLQDIADSPNIFLVVEQTVDKKTLIKITEVAEKVQPFDKLRAGHSKAEFNIFSLTDAFGKRDKKKLWVLYQRALQTDAMPEEIHGILFWQLKSMLLASGTKSAGEAGVAPFVFTKAKNFLKSYSAEELRALSSTLVRMYHDAHRGIHDFEIALERFILTL